MVEAFCVVVTKGGVVGTWEVDDARTRVGEEDAGVGEGEERALLEETSGESVELAKEEDTWGEEDIVDVSKGKAEDTSGVEGTGEEDATVGTEGVCEEEVGLGEVIGFKAVDEEEEVRGVEREEASGEDVGEGVWEEEDEEEDGVEEEEFEPFPKTSADLGNPEEGEVSKSLIVRKSVWAISRAKP